ncbi:hypothetical protein BASA81_011113 [Batrachochytrium salamandrivorans]|nr:hypothetical protein BASA81_011113 [Batrachochytrium salamandrivorans]
MLLPRIVDSRLASSRPQMLRAKREEMVSFQNTSINVLVKLLEDAHSASGATGWQGKTLSYDAFREMGQDPRLPQDGLLVRVLFAPSTFFQLPKDETGAVFVSMLFDFALEYRAQRLLRLDLAELDVKGTGHLDYSQVVEFVQLQTKGKSRLAGLTADRELELYHTMVARRIMFPLLLPSQRISIKSLLLSPMLSELKLALDEDNPVHNWFSPLHFEDLQRVFSQLDVDGNGTLTREEFSKIRLGGLNNHPSVTELVVNRIFESKLSSGGGRRGEEMNFCAFLDFVLASQHKQLVSALRYFWEIIDLESESALTHRTITRLLVEVKHTAIATGFAYHEKGVSVESVCDEGGQTTATFGSGRRSLIQVHGRGGQG